MNKVKTKIHTAYDPPPAVFVGKDPEWGPSKTRQSEMAACDINNVVKKYVSTGVLPANRADGIYADVAQMGDYRTAIEQIKTAEGLFMQLPSDVRGKFDNDPALFLDAVSDPSRRGELEELGLVKKPEPAPEAVEDPAPPSEADV